MNRLQHLLRRIRRAVNWDRVFGLVVLPLLAWSLIVGVFILYCAEAEASDMCADYGVNCDYPPEGIERDGSLVIDSQFDFRPLSFGQYGGDYGRLKPSTLITPLPNGYFIQRRGADGFTRETTCINSGGFITCN